MTPAPTLSMSTMPNRLLNPRSLTILFLAWVVLQFGGLFTPGLLDDVDSVYIQIAREMLARHDFVTPTIDGIRFFDKPPLMYWLAAGSMHVFGLHDWAARLPLAAGVLALFLAIYALGLRLYAGISPENPDRAALYAALATATSLGPYLYTRFFIPDILIALWMTLSVHLFLAARDRIQSGRSALAPSLGLAVVVALDVLTKGFIGVVFPLAFVLLFLLIRRELPLLGKLHILPATGVFLLIAAPWHILAALRNPAIALPRGVGLPSRAGWTWFYLYNEHVARFLGRRIPHDYGQVPVPLFWLLLGVWLVPWVAFLPSALRNAFAELRFHSTPRQTTVSSAAGASVSAHSSDAALATLLWAAIILSFFTLSSRQEYYHLPALPALTLLVGALLATADRRQAWMVHANQLGEFDRASLAASAKALRQTLRGSAFFLVPLGLLLSVVCGYFALTAHMPSPGADLYSVLNNDPAHYNLSLGHLFDLTGSAMGFFRGPLLAVALGMLVLGPVSHLLRRRTHTYAANLVLAAGMLVVLLAAHEGLVRFYPILGSKGLALAINQARQPGDLIAIDGELTSGSTLLFYTGQPVLLVNGRVNGPWFGSFWPDAPHIFLDETALHTAWAGPHRVFLLTYHPRERRADLAPFASVNALAAAGGKTVLTNKP